jgi:hypothetical protein
MDYLVYLGVYPFDEIIGKVSADTHEEGLVIAINQYKQIGVPSPVIEPISATH